MLTVCVLDCVQVDCMCVIDCVRRLAVCVIECVCRSTVSTLTVRALNCVQAVIFVISHKPEGSLGLILNRWGLDLPL
jgi:hypothetical protein